MEFTEMEFTEMEFTDKKKQRGNQFITSLPQKILNSESLYLEITDDAVYKTASGINSVKHLHLHLNCQNSVIYWPKQTSIIYITGNFAHVFIDITNITSNSSSKYKLKILSAGKVTVYDPYFIDCDDYGNRDRHGSNNHNETLTKKYKKYGYDISAYILHSDTVVEFI